MTYHPKHVLPAPALLPAVKNKGLISNDEMVEKRAKGLCYWCNEKYERGHKCQKKQLYLMDTCECDEEEEVSEGDSDGGEDRETPLISMHAICGDTPGGYRTMRVTNKLGKRALQILIDSGSTHNFMDLSLTKRLGLRLARVKPVRVDVADGNSISCDSICRGLSWLLQGTPFTTDVLLLPLGNCDVVLGVQWLETLGIIQWDFKNLRMEFTLNGKRHALQGRPKGQKRNRYGA